VCLRWIKSGTIDDIPATVLDAYPKLNRVFAAVRDDARIQSWAAKR